VCARPSRCSSATFIVRLRSFDPSDAESRIGGNRSTVTGPDPVFDVPQQRASRRTDCHVDERATYERPDPVPDSREEIVDHLGEAFTGSALTHDELLQSVRCSGVRSAVREVLHRLPERCFYRPVDPWPGSTGGAD
jgi:hypothetical protein